MILRDIPQKGLSFLPDVGGFYSLPLPHSPTVPDVTTGEPLSPVSCDPSAPGQVGERVWCSEDWDKGPEGEQVVSPGRDTRSLCLLPPPSG